jgi:hypothetical protein
MVYGVYGVYVIIIENELCKNGVYGVWCMVYGVWGVWCQPVQPRRGRDWVHCFVEAYREIQHLDGHEHLHKNIIKEWWNVEWWTKPLDFSLCHVVRCDELYVVCVLIRVLHDELYVLLCNN